MINRNLWQGPAAPLTDVLPPEFDAHDISSFFERASVELPDPKGDARGRTSSTDQNHAVLQQSEISQDTATGVLALQGLASENAIEMLNAADENAPVDLASLALPLRSRDVVIESDDFDSIGAGAKPDRTGGGDSGGNGGNKGKGKNKDTTADTPPAEDTTATEDTTPPEDTTVPEDTTPLEETTPPEDGGSAEINPGSNDPNIYVSGMDNPEGYNIEIAYVGEWSDSLRQHIQNVAEIVSDIITADLPSYNGVDDIRITATMTDIDGSGGYWGWGGTSSLRPDTKLPSTGYMQFDNADAASIESSGLWEDIMLHEMMHALGFGTTWSSMGLVENYDGDLRFTGTNAIEAYNTEFASIASNDALSLIGVPVETDGGSGTAGVHWDDATFTRELLTPNLRYSGNYLSDMSIAALEDMGYSTIYLDDIAIA